MCLGAAASILAGTAGSSLAADPPRAKATQQGVQKPHVAQAPASARKAPSAAEKRKQQREQSKERRKEWWGHAREVLFSGIELSDRQSRQVDALIEELLWNRSRAREIAAELGALRPQSDDNHERIAALREEQRTIRQERTSRQDLFEKMRSLLSEAQRPTFDMNRARLVAEHQARVKAAHKEPVSDPQSPSS
jgi:LTXXQ motif family protein